MASPSMHLTPARGTDEQNRAYCTKDASRVDGPWEIGDMASQGTRTDLEGLCEAVKNGRSDFSIAEECPAAYAKFGSHIKRLRAALNVPKWRDTVMTYVIVGPTSIGKSYFVHKEYPGLYKVSYSPQRIWWDGYFDQDVILLDEFNGK